MLSLLPLVTPFPVYIAKLMQVYFSGDWLALVELSFRNFLAEAIQHLPLPTLLRFDTDRLQRTSLQKQVEQLQGENAGLRQQLPASSKSKVAAPAQQTPHHRGQSKAASAQPSAEKPVGDLPPAQSRIRAAKDFKAAAPAAAIQPATQRQEALTRPSSASETSQWVQADALKQDLASQSDETAVESSGDSSQHLQPQAGLHIQSDWSASLTSLASSVLADSETAMPVQQNTTTDETLSLSTDASSPRVISEQADLNDPHLAESASVPFRSLSRGNNRQNKLSNGSLQTAAQPQAEPNEAAENDSIQQSAPLGSKAASFTRPSGNDPAAASRRVVTGSSQSQAAAEQLTSHDQGVTCCSFSPNGQNLATASADGVVRISAPANLQVQICHCHSSESISYTCRHTCKLLHTTCMLCATACMLQLCMNSH